MRTEAFHFLDDQCLRFGGIFQGFGVSHRESDGDLGAGFCLALIWIFSGSCSGRNGRGRGGENTRLA